MANEVSVDDGRNQGNVDGTNQPGSTDTGAKGTGTGGNGTGGRKKRTNKSTGTTATEKSGTKTGTDTEKEKIVSETPVLIEEQEEPEQIIVIPAEEEKPKKKKAPAKKKVTKKKKDDQSQFTEGQLILLMQTVSGIVASREGFECWSLTSDECKQIATPLYSIMRKSDVFSKIAEHGDAVALVTACTAVFAPRIFITGTLMKQKNNAKKLKRRGIEIGNENRQATKNSRSDNKDITTDGAPDGNDLLKSIPAIID